MPPKTSRSGARSGTGTGSRSRSGWKTGEQLQFLRSRFKGFKHAQDTKTLDRFWSKLLDDWYNSWPIPSSPSLAREYGTVEEARLMLQKEKNAQIKGWFNNQCRGTDSVKASRGDLKLDVNEKRKLAPVQAYCSYNWNVIQPIVITRWEAQKKSIIDDDDDSPSEEDEDSPGEPSIPLAFKLKIAKELYDKLSTEEKKEIDTRREEDREKLYRKIPDIPDDGERQNKLKIHKRNQQFVVKALNRVLANLEDQTGCVAQLFVASVDPEGGAPSIQEFCQGSTKGGLGFETFYGDDWKENVEDRFRQWAIRVFGEKGSERRNMFLLPKAPAAPSEASSSGPQPSTEASSQPSTEALSQQSTKASSQSPSTEATPSQKSTSQPSRPRKSVPRPSKSKKSMPHPSPMPTSAPQATVTSDSLQSTSTPTPNLPMPYTSINPPADTLNLDGDMALLSTAIGVHHLLSQVAIVPQVVQGPHMDTPGSPNTVEPSQLVINPSQLTAEPSQTVVVPSQAIVEPPQSVSERPKISAEVVPMDTQPNSTATPVPSQLSTRAANATSNAPTPKVPYRVRNTTTMPSGGRSRRDSIDGAPEMVVDMIDEEITVDLRDYISLGSDDDESHVSSSQKTADGCRGLSPPPDDSQQRHTSVGTTGGNTSQSELASGRTRPQLDIDEDDLPAWMITKGRWGYLTSTAGGTAWENLLKVYISQERRLEFTDRGAALAIGEKRPLIVKVYFRYAHDPARGDTLTLPDFGTEVAGWWEELQPEWRSSKQDLPQNPNEWSYILSGGSKGAFLVIMCLAWWDRAYERRMAKQKRARRAKAEAAGVTASFDDLPDHDAEWLSIVNDVAFVMQKARDSAIPTRAMPSPAPPTRATPDSSRKRKRQEGPVTPQRVQTVKRSSRKRTKA